MDKQKIAEAFEVFGPVMHVDLFLQKKIAFVTFKNPDLASSIIGKSVTINGDVILAEERRRSFTRTDKKFVPGEKPFYNNYKNNNNNQKQPKK